MAAGLKRSGGGCFFLSLLFLEDFFLGPSELFFEVDFFVFFVGCSVPVKCMNMLRLVTLQLENMFDHRFRVSIIWLTIDYRSSMASRYRLSSGSIY